MKVVVHWSVNLNDHKQDSDRYSTDIDRYIGNSENLILSIVDCHPCFSLSGEGLQSIWNYS